MTDQELIARLRHKTQRRSSEDTCAKYFKRWEELDNPDGPKAADRIEELAKERDSYLAERNKFQLYLQRTHADLELEVAAVEALNAKLANAVERSEQGWATAKAAVDRGMELERKLTKSVEALRYMVNPEFDEADGKLLIWKK